jgi:hypothetical protein
MRCVENLTDIFQVFDLQVFFCAGDHMHHRPQRDKVKAVVGERSVTADWLEAVLAEFDDFRPI